MPIQTVNVRCVCVVLSLSLHAVSISGYVSPTLIHLEGTHFEVGYQIGARFRLQIQDVVTGNNTLTQYLLPLYDSTDGREIYLHFLDTANTYFPEYVEELEGIAEGSGVTFHQLMLLHLESELSIYTGSNPYDTAGCSDFFLKYDQKVQLIHSEDVPASDGGGILVQVNITPETGSMYRPESFVAYAYVGTLPGNAFGYNSHGLTLSGNLVFQRHVNQNGIPRRFVNRALLTAKSVSDAITLAKTGPGIATSFSHNFGQRVCLELTPDCVHLINIELSGHPDAGTVVDRFEVTGFYYHFNGFQHLDVPVMPDISSNYRKKRMFDIVGIDTDEKVNLREVDILSLMSDTEQENYPIYRNGHPPDYLKTDAVALFDYLVETLSMFTGRPSQTSPVAVFSFKTNATLTAASVQNEYGHGSFKNEL